MPGSFRVQTTDIIKTADCITAVADFKLIFTFKHHFKNNKFVSFLIKNFIVQIKYNKTGNYLF